MGWWPAIDRIELNDSCTHTYEHRRVRHQTCEHTPHTWHTARTSVVGRAIGVLRGAGDAVLLLLLLLPWHGPPLLLQLALKGLDLLVNSSGLVNATQTKHTERNRAVRLVQGSIDPI